ncbi:diacylglycerol kinase family protein [Vaginisenegalia massiliensis]|uniref:diacylglycerol kinase family protein n=1 Tax=Vaginisenegalia massiliensis TaxID=2058294 RepID=UPI000F545D84|nr:diacylglycerol kinase family protein [Vaginisenegalia massiliensis]
MESQERSYKRFANPNFSLSFQVALEGLIYAIQSERNMRRHLLVMTLTLIAAISFQINRWEWLSLLLTTGLVLVAEMTNSAIEAVVDLVMGTRLDPLAKIAKDVAAGSVLVAATIAVINGLLIFGPYLLAVLN